MRSFNHQRQLFDSNPQSLISIQLWHLLCSLCGVFLLFICQMRNNSYVVLKCSMVLFKQCECFLLMSASPISSGLARSLLISSFACYPAVTRPANPQPPAKRDLPPIVPFHCPRLLAAREWLNAIITMKLSKASRPTTTHNVGNGAHNTLL